ncbi:hypothetical protein [Nocardia sp. BMG51109]|uniref:hypothetical protein n=1 Tax=Nocardia sp. BMG51109 TaxID=1056816 RepID=UPI0004640433|nr:hypothetical protein [Nocardia sp. BMG51109]
MADIGHYGTLEPDRACDCVRLPPAVIGALTDAGDRLVRSAFHVGLQLHHLRASPEDRETPRADAGTAVSQTVDDIDRLVREAGLAMLLLNAHGGLPTSAARDDERRGRSPSRR